MELPGYDDWKTTPPSEEFLDVPEEEDYDYAYDTWVERWLEFGDEGY